MNILDWLLHHNEARNTREQSERNSEALERILKIIPRLRMARRYQELLAPAVAAALEYESELVASLPSACEASVSAWSSAILAGLFRDTRRVDQGVQPLGGTACAFRSEPRLAGGLRCTGDGDDRAPCARRSARRRHDAP